jgi:hypothetical protein
MTAAVEALLARCRALDMELGIGSGGGVLLWEAPAYPPADVLAALERHKADILAAIRSPNGHCPHCGFALDAKRRCWRRGCVDRVCPCGRMTSTSFIELCLACDLAPTQGEAPPAQ